MSAYERTTPEEREIVLQLMNNPIAYRAMISYEMDGLFGTLAVRLLAENYTDVGPDATNGMRPHFVREACLELLADELDDIAAAALEDGS